MLGVIFCKYPLSGLFISARADWLNIEGEQAGTSSEPCLRSQYNQRTLKRAVHFVDTYRMPHLLAAAGSRSVVNICACRTAFHEWHLQIMRIHLGMHLAFRCLQSLLAAQLIWCTCTDSKHPILHKRHALTSRYCSPSTVSRWESWQNWKFRQCIYIFVLATTHIICAILLADYAILN